MTLRTRSAKGSELNHAELDNNFRREISQITSNHTVSLGDNRSMLECESSTPFTITLGLAAAMLSAETGDFEVTIYNNGSAIVTVARSGADTIDGSANNITLNNNDCIVLKADNSGSGYIAIADNGRDGLTGNNVYQFNGGMFIQNIPFILVAPPGGVSDRTLSLPVALNINESIATIIRMDTLPLFTVSAAIIRSTLVSSGASIELVIRTPETQAIGLDAVLTVISFGVQA